MASARLGTVGHWELTISGKSCLPAMTTSERSRNRPQSRQAASSMKLTLAQRAHSHSGSWRRALSPWKRRNHLRRSAVLRASPAAAGKGEAPAVGSAEAGISRGAGGGGGDCWPPHAGGVRGTPASLR
eukprot:15465050-Alexandrium_andersonii.AAC.1